ncbi:MAG: hypothetical protein AMJ79_08010 [Phycisphaerae bacterium SM23_30]|nr:MAG: hypothetical protein AMJ79_08010 [Phycisphaerae bacterium SM23_30]
MNDKWPHHGTMEPNLKYIKNNGVQKWLDAQQQQWSCKGCGAKIIWYQKNCPCGRQLPAWEVPV